MASVLLVSKPVGPPWNDSSKNMVRDLAWSMTRHRPVVMTRRGEPARPPGGVSDPVYPAEAGAFAPALLDNARVMRRLLAGRRGDLWHFFFAPNPRSSRAGALAARLRRMTARTVHTICSAPSEAASIDEVLFARCNVVLSRHTEQRMLAAGVPAARLRRIAPGIEPLSPPTAEARRTARRALALPATAPLWVYPGDLEFGDGAAMAIDALAAGDPETLLVMACRVKTAGAREAESELRARAARRGIADRVLWIGETPHIHGLLGAADVVALPADTLYAKMDYPLVLIEAMTLGRPVVVTAGTAAEELGEHGARVVAADADAVAAAVDALLADADLRARVGDAARAGALAALTRDRMAGAYEALYDELA